MTVEINGEKYFTLREFAEKVDRKYSYIRKCARNLQKAKDISKYVTYIEDKPFISEDALKEFS